MWSIRVNLFLGSKNSNLLIFSQISTPNKPDEEIVMEETRKHKNHYFPSLKRHQLQKPENKLKDPDANSDAVPYNSQKPVNFLFSNDNDFDDEGSSDETWR